MHRQRRSQPELPEPADDRLVFFVREPWPSISTGCELSEGLLEVDDELELVSEMNTEGVVFGDGIEQDRLPFGWVSPSFSGWRPGSSASFHV